MEQLEEYKVQVIISYCQKCNGWVTVAIKHLMSQKENTQFMRDVIKYDLLIKTMPLVEYRNTKMNSCNCEKK